MSIVLLILDFNKVEIAFYSVFDHRTEKIHFESKSGIKSNFDFIEIRNKKQNTHVMPNYFENYFWKLLCSKSEIKSCFEHMRHLLDSQIWYWKDTPRMSSIYPPK